MSQPTQLLLLSNSTMPGTPFFTWPRPYVKAFLPANTRRILFIPYAAVTFSFDEYARVVGEAFQEMGYAINSIHTASTAQTAVEEADAIVIGGGNTFALLTRLYQNNLIELIRNKVKQGTPYIGWSAGANVACPTIMTTNDMPIMMPPSFDALDLVPFQINPHYTEVRLPNHGGETRLQRIQEFQVVNTHRSVIGLPEGLLLHRRDRSLFLDGPDKNAVAKIFVAGKPVEEAIPGTELDELL